MASTSRPRPANPTMAASNYHCENFARGQRITEYRLHVVIWRVENANSGSLVGPLLELTFVTPAEVYRLRDPWTRALRSGSLGLS